MVSMVCLDKHPRVLARSQFHGREGRLDRVGSSQMRPMLGWIIVEGQQLCPILGQTGCGLRKLQLVGGNELVKGPIGILSSFCHPDLMQRRLGFWLYCLGLIVEHITGLVHPAALLSGIVVDFGQGFPASEPLPIASFGPMRRPLKRIPEQLPPELLTFPVTIFYDNQCLLTVRSRLLLHLQDQAAPSFIDLLRQITGRSLPSHQVT